MKYSYRFIIFAICIGTATAAAQQRDLDIKFRLALGAFFGVSCVDRLIIAVGQLGNRAVAAIGRSE